MTRARPTVAILLSTSAFEEFYGDDLGLDRNTYIEKYRNDWSWEYASALRGQGLRPLIYVATYGSGELRSAGGIGVRFLPLTLLDLPWRRLRLLRRSPLGRYAHQWLNAKSLLPALSSSLREDGVSTLMVQEYWTARWDVLSRLAIDTVAIDQGQPTRREIKAFKARSFQRAKAIVAQTNAEAARVRRYGGDPVVLPNGVDTVQYRPPDGGERNPRELLIVARLLDVQKRISDVLRALERLEASWTLRVLGGGPDEASLRELSRSLGVADRVSFEGFIFDRAKIIDAFQACGVFVIPSAYEGLPMALLEAMACGCAIVGSTIAPIAEVVEADVTGLTVAVGDVDGIAARICEASDDAARLGTAARTAAIERFSLEACGQALATLIASPEAHGQLAAR